MNERGKRKLHNLAMEHAQFEFNSFLLQISKELTANEFQQLKFVLKGSVTSAKCEEMTEAFLYFGELQKLLLVTPTRFEVLKKAFYVIGRADLTEKLREKEQEFASLFSPQLKDGDSLQQKEYDAVCDGIDKAAGNLKPSPRSEPSTSNVKKQIKLIGETENDVPVDELLNASLSSELMEVPTWLKQMDGMKNSGEDDSFQPAGSQPGIVDTSSKDGNLPGTMNAVNGLISCENSNPSKTGQTVPSGIIAVDGNDVNAGESSIPATAIQYSSKGPGDDVVPDCGNEDKEGESKKESSDKETANKEANLEQKGAHDFGGARPKDKQGKLSVSLGTVKTSAEEGIDEGTETMETLHTHGTLIYSSTGHGAVSSEETSGKMPTEDECSSPTPCTGQISYKGDSVFEDTEAPVPSQQNAKTSKHSSGQGVDASGQSFDLPDASSYKQSKGFSVPQQGMPTSSAFQTSQGACGYNDDGLSYGSTPFGSEPLQGIPTDPAAQTEMLQQLLFMEQLGPGAIADFVASQKQSSHQPISGSSGAKTSDSPVPQRSYDKSGYSVVISNGTLCDSSEEKGVVMMKTGTQFYIAIRNNNDCDAEVDITFGGIFLGVWVVEAKQAFKVEGSSWTTGRLRFFSKSDSRRLEHNKEFDHEHNFDGIIELEFKPQVLMLKLVVKHVWKEGTQEILMPDFKTASIADLKQEISKKYACGVSCLIVSGNVLQEHKTMSSYALENTNEVIQVLYMAEELQIESPGKDPVTMTVDPFEVSKQNIKDFLEEKVGIGVNEQHLSLNGQNLDYIDRLSDIFTTAKKKPVIKVVSDRNINIEVLQPNGNKEQVQVNWFATVSELKEKLVEQGSCETNATLTYNNVEITEGEKKLVDLDFKPHKSIIKVHPHQRSTHRGFSAEAFARTNRSGTRGFGSGTTRGFGSEVTRGFSSGSTRGIGDDECEFSGPYPAAARTFRNGPGGIQCDSGRIYGKEGMAILFGNEESVYKQFQEDRREMKFSKERAVTLIIQLIEDERPTSSGQSPWAQKGPMSTPTPPPVPE